ncbi:denticleless homolog [Ectocarpus siliculosus]|uniref:Denticleless homolog n=1 Tax=Ectocarpus siliculosus TaxID=2880 RepID=D8LHZ2_ECTSI|nr:denticleless homolog [Ectocarpus siliculosus]|eukprot:CBN74423.1 denticleless homolog [Ectocarpus siliculosus]
MAPTELRRWPGSSRRGAPAGRHGYGSRYEMSDYVMGLASPGAFPCPEGSPTYNLQFSKRAGDGHFVAFGTERGTLVIVDTRAEAVVQRDHNGPVGWGQTDRSSGWFSERAAKRLGAISAGVKHGYCRSWGVRQPGVVAQYRALANCIFDVEWLHDDGRIALACADSKIRVHDTETCMEVVVLRGHEGSVKTISANPLDNCVVLSGARDGSFAVWDTRLQQGRPVKKLMNRVVAEEYSAMAWAPANRLQRRMLTPVEQVFMVHYTEDRDPKIPRSYVRMDETVKGGFDGMVCGRPCASTVTSVQWMPDGQKFLTAGQDGLVKLWDTRYVHHPLQEADPDDESASPPLLSENSRSMWTLDYGKPVPRSGATGAGTGGSGGRRASAGTAKGRRRRRAVSYGSVSGGDAVAEESTDGGGRRSGVSSVHACDDGSRIAVCTVKNRISVYAYTCGGLRPLGAYTGNANRSSYYIKAKLSPDGSLLASGATDDAVCLWQVDCPGLPVARLTGHMNEVTGLDWCRAEPLKLATSSDDETVRVWTIDPLRVRHHSASAPVVAVAGASARSSGGALGSGPAVVGGSSVIAGSGSGGGVRSYPCHGKFGEGGARRGESSLWRRRAPVGNRDGDQHGHGGDVRGPLVSRGDGSRGQQQVRGDGVERRRDGDGSGGSQGRDHQSHSRGTGERTDAAASDGGGGGGGGPPAVFSPCSPNKRPGPFSSRPAETAARAKGATAAAVGGGGIATAPAHGDTSQRFQASSNNGGTTSGEDTPDENVDSRRAIDASAEPPTPPTTGSGVVAVSKGQQQTGGSRKGGRRGVMEGLPRGVSSAAWHGKGFPEPGRGRRPRQHPDGEQQQQRQEATGSRKKAKKGASGQQLPRESHTLMAFWCRGRGGASSGVGQGKAGSS